MGKLKGIRVAALMADGFEEVEFTKPCAALKAQGAEVKVISPNNEKVKAFAHTDWSKNYSVDVQLDEANPADYDALLLPGGVMNPDKLRVNDKAVNFVKHFLDHNKPIAAICHAPWTLIETKKVKGRKLTSYHSIKTDLINAGADWQDEEVIVDDRLITSRKPDDIPAFIEKMIENFQNSSNNHGRE